MDVQPLSVWQELSCRSKVTKYFLGAAYPDALSDSELEMAMDVLNRLLL